jgi:hypothetical protein
MSVPTTDGKRARLSAAEWGELRDLCAKANVDGGAHDLTLLSVVDLASLRWLMRRASGVDETRCKLQRQRHDR